MGAHLLPWSLSWTHTGNRKWQKSTPWAQRTPLSHRPPPREPGSLPTLGAVVEVNGCGLMLSKYRDVELSGERPDPQRKVATERG